MWRRYVPASLIILPGVDYWQRVESHIGEHSGATFTHGVCPECVETRVRPEIERSRREAL